MTYHFISGTAEKMNLSVVKNKKRDFVYPGYAVCISSESVANLVYFDIR